MKNIIIFSSIDWDDNWQLHQEIALYFKKIGNNVLFIENTGSRAINNLNDFSRIFKRIKAWWNSSAGFRFNKNGLLLYSPISIPFPNSKIIEYINSRILMPKINYWLRQSEFKKIVTICFLPTPLNYKIIKKINSNIKIFYYADSLDKNSKDTKYLKPWIDKTIKKSDFIFTPSTILEKKIKKINYNSYLINNGLNNFFNRTKDIKKNRIYDIGYIGSISNLLDFNLIINIAKKFYNKKILLLGPSYCNLDFLKKYKNIEILDKKNFPEIISYYNNIKIGIIPYKKNKYTETVFPTKLSEYIASGCEVISVNIKEVNYFNQKYPNLITVAKNKNIFLKSIEKKLDKNSHFKTNKLIKKYVNSCSWEEKFEFINKIIDKKFLEINFEYVEIVNLIKRQFSFLNIFKLKYLFLTSFIIFFLFTSIGIQIISKPLVTNKNEEKVGAVFVLSGTSGDFQSADFLLRIKEAAQLINKDLSSKIILTSQNYSNENLNSAITSLQAYGINRENIFIINNQEIINTFENLKAIDNFKKIYNLKKIGIYTHPFHSTRANLMSKKLNIDDIIFFNNLNSINFNKLIFQKKIILLQIIFHEYLSIIYNYFKNRI